MISVLVPVYNANVVSLINELGQQLKSLPHEGEILVFDDCSSSAYREHNKEITGFRNVIYKELDRNYGRTAIRQLLAAEAKYEWLLFLDSDSRILRSDFLQRYLNAFKNGFDICVGGRAYPAKPVECNKTLHWKYGVKRESAKGGKTAFHTNNFCIRKEIFLQLKFPAVLKQYGHEDSWMAIELERLGKKIVHLNNSVEHVQIETADDFLKKTNWALQNLLLLEEITDRRMLRRHVSLFNIYDTVKRFHLKFAVHFIYSVSKKRIARSLQSCNPSLFYFDLYRLDQLIKLSQEQKSG